MARNSPLDIILNFHSTIVMNLISHSHAYCLYPRALQDKVSLICCSDNRPDRDDACSKYVDRGYYMINGDGRAWRSRTGLPSPTRPSDAPQFNHAKVFDYFYISKDRHLEDRLVWKILLDPITEPENAQLELPWIFASGYPIMPPLLVYECLTSRPVIETNSWSLEAEEPMDSDLQTLLGLDDFSIPTRYKVTYTIYQQPTLRHTYCLSQRVIDNFVHTIEAILFRDIFVDERKAFLRDEGQQHNDFLEHVVDMDIRQMIKIYYYFVSRED
ncbi:hypothetical protein BDP27DRAFT_1430184 [Rhodocollybia butyracea]|uniref:Uncharacterized protein n=1 Tax=Rhodocollybia butyracea TaxID=206335 RepID=A0A9P5P7J9_9AGAR|nr:hypothetical protein BDP27DRAFT_1430184 [Rhodocollybia butyracea]